MKNSAKRVKVNHPFDPIYNKDSKVLLLGSMPSITSREKNFYFSHPQNDFWKILELIFDEKIEDKTNFILKHNLALWDVIKSCDITSSSDASIKNVKVNDIKRIVNNSNIKAIFTIGSVATKYYEKYVEQSTKIKAHSLPSTSPAYRKMKLEEKVKKFETIKTFLK